MRPAIIASIHLLLLLVLLARASNAVPYANFAVTTCQPPMWTDSPTTIRLTTEFVRYDVNVEETSVYDKPFHAFLVQFNELSHKGWGLHVLRARVSGTNVLYTGVWRRTQIPEETVFGLEWPAFWAQFTKLWWEGWRLEILTQYVLNDKVYFSAVWRKPMISVDEVRVFGWKFNNFKAKYDAIRPQNWRLHILDTYVVNDEVFYSAVWRRSDATEIQVYSVNLETYTAKYTALWPLGYQLHIINQNIVKGVSLYTAVWRHTGGGASRVDGENWINFKIVYTNLWCSGWRINQLAVEN
ncbi:hypothetical protein BC938DRAFT_482536 [Jimgerdemannia flammicorona]|uniref:Uncharacterized protein n=1 Tax=Jimgerdemannia flammicorona TaxID=994334 RepID=A0A433QDW2_9FUNG|nr:hypothetical protein BC938DRAFT_482536 [Jimgerdemannia flammicorona]